MAQVNTDKYGYPTGRKLRENLFDYWR
jgi:hypothetical protein